MAQVGLPAFTPRAANADRVIARLVWLGFQRLAMAVVVAQIYKNKIVELPVAVPVLVFVWGRALLM